MAAVLENSPKQGVIARAITRVVISDMAILILLALVRVLLQVILTAQ